LTDNTILQSHNYVNSLLLLACTSWLEHSVVKSLYLGLYLRAVEYSIFITAMCTEGF